MIDLETLRATPDAGFDVPDDYDAANDFCLARGWTDGLPVVPPTAERVARMLTYCHRRPDSTIAAIPPRYGAATVLRVAANAVMAGCRPEYFPLVILAIEALCEEPFNLYAVQATTHSCAPLIIVNGPVAKELGMNAGHGALGSGTHSNATIGRAVRLSLVNIGGAIPGVGDMGTYGSPAKFSYCAPENETASPWEPLHVERGLPRDVSAVTVVSAEGPHNINDHESTSAAGILKTMAGTIATIGGQNVYHPSSEIVVLICPEHAATIAGEGYSKNDVKAYLFANARRALGEFSEENVRRRFKVKFGDRYLHSGPNERVPMVQSPDKYIPIVLGGAGKHSAYIPSFGNTLSVTRMLRLADGTPARSIHDFRQS
ncbi:MAG TPA: hypothetical protein VHP37_32105 [Burkholderiales bacterium]|nr:hypothetical protein [Burkholderiales bacterium]